MHAPITPSRAEPSLRAADLFDWPLAGPNLPDDALQALALFAAVAGCHPSVCAPACWAWTCDSSGILSRVLQESDALSFMPRFMAEDDLRSAGWRPWLSRGLTQSVRFGAAWLRGRALGGGAGEKFVALLHEHDAALRSASVSAASQSSP